MADPSAYATRDPARHAAELGRLDPDDVHEFYQPFTMVEDLVELVRVINPTYGEMDMAVVLEAKPPHVYVNSDAGERFLRDRFPDVQRHRVAPEALHLNEFDRGHAIAGELTATTGPFREISLLIRTQGTPPFNLERYEGASVWGSPITCHGIDMRLAAHARGYVRLADGREVGVNRSATLFRGSYGKLAPARNAVTQRVAAASRKR